MEYREIVAITGLGGLFQLLATKSDGAIVRNLADNNTKFISSRMHNVTPLESIEIYTTGENVRLHEVLGAMKASTVAQPGAKANNDEIRNYVKTVFPDIDEDRVYTSDMKKMLKWYELLAQNDLLDFSKYNKQAEAEETTEPEVSEPPAEEKPAKKAKAKKEEETPAATEEAPAKKTAKKKATEVEATEGEEPKKKAVAKKKKEAE